jgi:hypothetical protein
MAATQHSCIVPSLPDLMMIDRAEPSLLHRAKPIARPNDDDRAEPSLLHRAKPIARPNDDDRAEP